MNTNNISRDYLEIGTKIYYTGDMANIEGFGEIIDIKDSKFYGPKADIYVKLEDGRDMRILPLNISNEYHGTCNPRFVTLDAYNRYHDEVVASFNKRYNIA